MNFFSGKLGLLERMMKDKPGYHRRNRKSGKHAPNKKSISQTVTGNHEEKRKDKNHDG